MIALIAFGINSLTLTGDFSKLQGGGNEPSRAQYLQYCTERCANNMSNACDPFGRHNWHSLFRVHVCDGNPGNTCVCSILPKRPDNPVRRAPLSYRSTGPLKLRTVPYFFPPQKVSAILVLCSSRNSPKTTCVGDASNSNRTFLKECYSRNSPDSTGWYLESLAALNESSKGPLQSSTPRFASLCCMLAIATQSAA